MRYRFSDYPEMTKEPPMVGRGGAAVPYPTEITGDGVAIVAPTGRLDLPVAPDFGQHLIDLVEAGHTRVVVDLSEVELLDSSGLGALVAGFEAARDNGGDLKLMSPAEQPRLVLELTNVNRLLHTVTSVEMAFDDHT